MINEDLIHVTINLEKEDRRKLKILAAEQDTSVSNFLRDWIRSEWAKREEESKN